MSLSRFRPFAAAGALVVGLATLSNSAQADIVASASVTGAPLAGYTGTVTFTGSQPFAGVNLAFSGTGSLVTGSSNTASAPYVSTSTQALLTGDATGTANRADVTQYVSTGMGFVDVTFTGAPVTSFGLLWGSVDSFNSLQAIYSDGTFSNVIGGNTVLPGANGNQGAGGSVYANFTTTDGKTIRGFRAASTGNAFEFDALTFTAVPEPASVLLGLGLFGAMGVVVARTRKAKASA